jgi:hypothetical protein
MRGSVYPGSQTARRPAKAYPMYVERSQHSRSASRVNPLGRDPFRRDASGRLDCIPDAPGAIRMRHDEKSQRQNNVFWVIQATSALPHSEDLCVSALALCLCINFPKLGCSLRLDRCTSSYCGWAQTGCGDLLSPSQREFIQLIRSAHSRDQLTVGGESAGWVTLSRWRNARVNGKGRRR